MAEHEKKEAHEEAIQEEMAHLAKSKSRWEELWKKEDWMVCWIGGFLLLLGLILAWGFSKPPEMREIIETNRAIIAQEQERAPFRTIEKVEAENKLDGLRARGHGVLSSLQPYFRRPAGWESNPIDSFYRSEEEAARMRAEAQPRHEAAQERTKEARAKAEIAQARAAAADFEDRALNREAEEAIAEWVRARSAESSARSAATTQAFNLFPTLLALLIAVGLLMAAGTSIMGRSAGAFLVGWPAIFIIATIGFMIGSHSIAREYGLGYPLWCILIGLLISNTIGVPKFIKAAVQTEYFIKTGLVLLGGSILFGLILMIGAPGIVVAWVVTPSVLIIGYWVGNKYIKVPSKPLNMCICAAASVCGVSAAIAAAAASKAKGEELTIAVGMSLVFTAVFMFLIPAFVVAVGMNPILGGAWVGGTVDSTGAVVAAGEILGPGAMYTAATLKMIQNVLIGVLGFGIAAYWTIKVEREGSTQVLSFSKALHEIWTRFPKFIIGFAVASIAFTIIYEAMGRHMGDVIIDEGALRGFANPLRVWFFALAFTSIGLASNFRELAQYFAGGKIVIHYIFTQGFNVILTLIIAWIMFMLVFPGITEHLMEIRY